MKHTKGKTELDWRVNTGGLLKEILQNQSTQILRQPIAIFGSILALVGKRALEINDPELNKLMLKLAIYAEGDPYSDGFNQKVYNKAMKVKNDEYTYLRAAAPEMLEALEELTYQVSYHCPIQSDPKLSKLLKSQLRAEQAIQKATK